MSTTSDQNVQQASGLIETVKVVVQALALALVVKSFLFQPFSIPSGSMKSTLLVGDYLFVSKYSYGYSKYSFPLSLPLFDGRIFGSEPERGDVIVFKLPKDNETDYIKRLIGLPGDRIQMKEGVLHINGTAVKKERIEDFVEIDDFGNEQVVKRYRETLPNGVVHTTLDLRENGILDNTIVYKVPKGHYFFMGDNRDNSTDSRVTSFVGYVPFENLIGKAEITFFSIGDNASPWQLWKWPTSARWSRIFNGL
ncbi:MAG: signal peptidase I [Cohaesibacteraceae bacterium]|nr:signal peptidase I [Cohaesibacteraceae bacterium]MBL4876789.1 signal peptidase I [Cohaesibacteraceae bacterium]